MWTETLEWANESPVVEFGKRLTIPWWQTRDRISLASLKYKAAVTTSLNSMHLLFLDLAYTDQTVTPWPVRSKAHSPFLLSHLAISTNHLQPVPIWNEISTTPLASPWSARLLKTAVKDHSNTSKIQRNGGTTFLPFLVSVKPPVISVSFPNANLHLL